MDLIARWTTEAEQSFETLIEYLENNWSEKEVRNFVRKTNEVIKQIEKNPYQYRSSSIQQIRIAVTTKHNSLIYHVNEQAKKIDIYTFWDNRKDPGKLAY